MKHASWIFLLLILVLCELPLQLRAQGPNDSEPTKQGEFEMKKVCFDVARHVYEKDFEKSKNDGVVVLKPLYTYSKKLNTCVMYGGFVDKDETSFFIFDALTNVEIASSILKGNKTIEGLSKEDFNRKKKAFFPDAP